VWDTTSWAEPKRYRQKEGVFGVAFGPDDRWLAFAASESCRVSLLDLERSSVFLRLNGHANAVYAVAVSPDGTRLASTSENQTVRIWDIRSSRRGEVSTALHVLTGHTGVAKGVAFSPDGTRLATASDDHTVKIWDAETGEEYITLRGHLDRVTSVVFSPDGNRLASTSQDKTVRIWEAPREDSTGR
jgi:WD40 repeat protein